MVGYKMAHENFSKSTFMNAPNDLRHMRLAILTREIKTLFTPVYVFANAHLHFNISRLK
jgi:hypothetical protein